MALLTSIKAISDLFRIYGLAIFGQNSNRTEESNITINHLNTTKRRLYRNDGDDNSLNDLTSFNFELVIEIMLDILDDEVILEFRSECIIWSTNKLNLINVHYFWDKDTYDRVKYRGNCLEKRKTYSLLLWSETEDLYSN